MIDDRERFLVENIVDVWFATIKVNVLFPDGSRAFSVMKLDERELHELGPRPKLEDYKLVYHDDERTALYRFYEDKARWNRKADYLANLIGSKVANDFIRALEAGPK